MKARKLAVKLQCWGDEVDLRKRSDELSDILARIEAAAREDYS